MNLLRPLAIALLALGPIATQAATFHIADHDTEGLIAAIQAAETSREPDRIELAPHGLYVLKQAADAGHEFGLPQIHSALTIVGNDAEIRRYSDQDFALIGVATTGKLALESLTLAEGARGAVVNRGVLHLDGVRITDNNAGANQSIVLNYGVLRGSDSEISYNTVLGASREVGIVTNYGRLELSRSRLIGNHASGRRGAVLAASAILNLGETTLHDVDLRDNDARVAYSDGARASTVLNLGNGALHEERVVLQDNWPDNWPGDAPASLAVDTDSILP